MNAAFRSSLSPVLLAAVAFAACFSSASEACAQPAYVAQLRGQVNVPSNGSGATGSAIAVLDLATSTLKYEVDVSGLTGSVLSAEADLAAVGVNGPLLFTLEGAAPHFAGTSPVLTPSQLAELQALRVYFTVRTTTFPLGQIRGQLTLGASQFYSLLSGAKAVPPSPTPATGYANFGLLADGIQLTCMVHASLTTGTAYLKEGAPGVAGATIGTIPYDFAGVWHAVVPLSPMRVELLKAGLIYVEIPSAPDAVVRGQLTGTTAKFGSGSGSALPPMLQLSYAVTLTGGVPNSVALLLLSPSAGLATAAGCKLYVGIPAAASFVLPLDASGGASVYFVQVPPGTPTPLALTMQALCADPSASNGKFTSSNAVTYNVVLSTP